MFWLSLGFRVSQVQGTAGAGLQGLQGFGIKGLCFV